MVSRIDWRVVERQALLMADWRTLLEPHVGEARQVLRQLLAGPVRFTPIIEAGRKGARFEGAIVIGEIFAGNLQLVNVASPVRIERTA